MRCEICNQGPAQGVTVFRINAKASQEYGGAALTWTPRQKRKLDDVVRALEGDGNE